MIQKPRTIGFLLWLVVVSLLTVLVFGFMPLKARAHDPYSGWKKPDNPGTSCCDNTDCRPTRAYIGEDGLWRAWNGFVWLTIPRAVMLPKDYAKDGRSHLCEREGYVYCFTAAEPKS